MMSKRFLAYMLLPVLGLGLAAPLATNAMGFGGRSGLSSDEIATNMQNRFTEEAALLGLTVDEVKAAWAEGKTMLDLAKEHGITEEALQQKMKDARLTQMKANIQNLVSQGIITQAQADARISFMQNNVNNMQGKKSERGMRGMGGWMGF